MPTSNTPAEFSPKHGGPKKASDFLSLCAPELLLWPICRSKADSGSANISGIGNPLKVPRNVDHDDALITADEKKQLK